MNIKDSDGEEKKAAFFDDFMEKCKKYPLGSMPKRDLDCLIFFLLKKHGLIPGTTNRDKAYSLGISETKFKSYLVDADAKFGERDPEESIRRIFGKLNGGESGASVEGDTLVFVEEDPVVKADFSQAMKEAGFYTDTSFNSEIIKVKAASFLSFARAKGYLADDKILAILNTDKDDADKIQNFKDANKSMKDIMQDVFGILKGQEKFGIQTLAKLFTYVSGVVQAKHDGGRA